MAIIRYLIAFLILSVPAFAADHYVASNGTDTWNNSTNIATPCSWSTAMANAAAGDTVYFRGGTYNLGTFGANASLRGTATMMYPANSGTGDADAQRIIFKAYTGETPVITGTVDANSQENYFGCGGQDYITWDGFSATFQHNQGSYESNVAYANGTYCTIKNMTLTGITYSTANNNNASLIRVEDCTNCLVENNYIDNLIGGTNNTAGIWIFGDTGPNTVRNNTVFNSSGGIFAKTGVTQAQVYNNFLYVDPNGTVGSFAMKFNFQGGTASNGSANIYQNVVVWRGIQEQAVIQIMPPLPASGGYNFYNNTIYAPTETGGSGEFVTDTTLTNLSVWNNVFQSASRYVTYTSGSVAYSDNNIFYTGGTNSWVLGSNYTSLANWQATGFDLASYVEDPTFDNVSGTTPESFKISAAHKNSGRGGAYASVIGAYITGDELIGYQAGGVADTVPAQFTFTDVTGASLSTQYTSNAITVTGIDNTTTLTLTGTGCEYSINGAAFATADDNVSLNDNVALQVTSSANYSTAKNCVLNLGGVSDTYTVTTLAAVSDPAAPRMRAGSMAGGWR